MKITWVDPHAARPKVCSLELPAGLCVREVLQHCGWEMPAEEAWGFSIWGRAVEADYILQEGDRLELCPPLVMSPMEARRQRAAAQKKPSSSD